MNGGILNDQGPTSSLEEDLQALGLAQNVLSEQKKIAESKPAPEEKAKADARIEIPVRQESKEPEEPVTEEPVTEEEPRDWSDDEIVEMAVEVAKEEGADPEIVAEVLKETYGIDLEQDEEDDEEDEEDEEEPEEEEEQDSKMESVIDVLRSFYEHIDALAEGTEEKPSYDDLVGVIEAFEYINEDLIAEARFGKKGGKAYRGAKRQKKTGFGKKMKKIEGRMHGKHKYTREGLTKAQLKTKLATEIRAAKSPRYKKALKVRQKELRHSVVADTEPKGEALHELVSNLKSLGEAVSKNKETHDFASELREGYESVMNTAGTWMTRIAEEVRETLAEDADPDKDPRVHIGRHLDSIGRDAAKLIAKIDEGAVTEETVEQFSSDLATLAEDLKDAAEAMKQVE
jgi:hypothetical protein